jgi:SPP1 gp7 family putative phage head morphogenesis protein
MIPPRFPDGLLDAIIEGIYSGEITEMDLPESLYYAIANYLKKGLYEGFGADLDTVSGTNTRLLTELRENIYVFSGAKTFQEVRIMSDALTNADGKLRSFREFKELALKFHEEYNINYLKTEYQTAVGQAQSAAKWAQIEADKDALPLLQYSTTGGENVCDICGPLNGITAEVGDRIWNSIAPINHFNCMCVLIQLDEGKVSKNRNNVVGSVTEKMKDRDGGIFLFNPGKEGVVFSDKHPYFTVPKDMVKRAQENFDLPIPTLDN